MHLDRRQREDRQKRRGLTGRTLLMGLWWAICLVATYFASEWIFAQGLFTPAMVYRAGLSPTVPAWVIQGILMIILVLVMQFFVILGYLVASPAGRRRLGLPTIGSSNQDVDNDR